MNRICTMQVELQNLPIEVISIILGYLPLRDRKNARLASKRLNDACNVLPILRTEKLYCTWIDNVPKTLETIMKSQRYLLNLHFYGFKFAKHRLFWETCGSRIRSLDFMNCVVNDEIVEIMLAQCSKLEHLSWYWDVEGEGCKGTHFTFNTPETNAFCTNDLLESLTGNQITYKNLISLNIEVNYGWELSNYTLYKLFSLFPNIKKFSFRYPGVFRVTDLSESELLARDRLSCSSIVNIIRLKASELESIKLPVITYGNKYRLHLDTFRDYAVVFDSILKIPNLTRLKEVHLTISECITPHASVIRFLAELKSVESATLMVDYRTDYLLPELLSTLLDHCPKLRCLKCFFWCACTSVWETILRLDLTVFKKIVTSHLVTLTLHVDRMIFDPTIFASQESLVNYTLRELQLFPAVSKEFIDLHFLKIFVNLNQRCFSRGKEQLQILPAGEYKKTVRILRLCDSHISDVLDGSPLGKNIIDDARERHVFQELEVLEVLEIDGPECIREILGYQLPALRYLYLETRGSADVIITTLMMLCQCPNNLEELKIHILANVVIPYDVWKTVLASMKGLRYLEIQSHNGDTLCFEEDNLSTHLERKCNCFSFSTLKDLFFNISPSLRVLKLAFQNDVHYRDVFKNEVHRISCSDWDWISRLEPVVRSSIELRHITPW